MKYLLLGCEERRALLAELAGMPEFLAERLGSLAGEAVTRPAAGGGFSPVEHCWHLADLEREAFGVRIERLRLERDPLLADFDGSRIAEERQYKLKALPEAIAAFREVRARNLSALATVSDEEWTRGGTQEGVGPVSLCDLPQMMVEHDRAHRAEIEAWLRAE